ncbi:MAG: 3-carboxy-cis,cis-muconate cycloisomerase [Gemmatimonadetes bacterium]|nr:3-carboxy-cis,cis-muconate cycloisomerase [Gemmatimonadota bacterium]
MSDVLFSSPAMAELFTPRAMVAAMLRVELALARALARADVIPADAADAIAAACRVELYDADAVFDESATAGTPVIPLVRMLTERVDTKARGWVHWGATSQDIIDTAMVLQMRAGIELLARELRGVAESAAALADRYRYAEMAGRTLGQHAAPITFGLKAARWLALTTRQIRALEALPSTALPLQFGGAVGTLAPFGDSGPLVAAHLAEELALPLPELPWHAERDRIATVAAALGVAAGAMSKIASDVALLAQTEIGEVAEGAQPGKGGSSAMPQKRNPVDAMSALAAARLAIGLVPTLMSGLAQEHERAIGAWQAEWVALPHVFRHTAGAVMHVRRSLAGLEVHHDRMRQNLSLAGGTLMAEALSVALAPRLGRTEAQSVVKSASERALREGIPLQRAALDDARISSILSADDVNRALNPSRYLGSADAFINRALASLPDPSRDAPHATARVEIDGLNIAYRVDGDVSNPALVLINSLGTDLRVWEPQADSLSQYFRVIRYDARGHGESDVPAEPATIDRLGADLVALLDHLNIERAHLCGLSLGGLTALWVAVYHADRVGRAVFANASARFGTTQSWDERMRAVRAGGMEAISETVVGRFFGAPFRAEHPDLTRFITDMVEATPVTGYLAACAAVRDADLRDVVSRIRAPSLVLAGELDQSAPLRQSEELHASISGSELVVLPGAAHLSNLEQAEEFTRLVTTFLRGL